MLSKIRHYVDKNTIRSLYFSLFSSHISYCCQVWCQNGNYHLNKILSFQRSTLRIINFQPFRSNASFLFRSLNIPLFFDLVRISNILFVFDSLSRNLPISIANYFCQSCASHSYNTRNTQNGKLVVPTFKSAKYGKNSIIYQCTIEWNKSIKEINNIFLTKYANSQIYGSFLDLNSNQFSRLIRTII